MPRSARLFACLIAAIVALPTAPAFAISPRNPYRSFNLSGINYGSMQWERDQRAGKVVWPYYNVPSRNYYRGGAVSVGGSTATTTRTYRTSPRRWRR
jgi:hypothetical protein